MLPLEEANHEGLPMRRKIREGQKFEALAAGDGFFLEYTRCGIMMFSAVFFWSSPRLSGARHRQVRARTSHRAWSLSRPEVF